MPAPSALHRLADDGKWYDAAEFQKFYPHDYDTRWTSAPQALERRIMPGCGMYRTPEDFFLKFGDGGVGWNKNGKPGWDNALQEKRLADDGNWYTLQQFQEFYASDWQRRFEAAPANDETRYDTSVDTLCTQTPRDAQFFYEKNKRNGGPQWNINQKALWQEASLTKPAVVRLANDGKWYTAGEFEKFYPGQSEYWDYAPKKGELRRGSDGLEHDAMWFFEKYGGEGCAWKKGYRAGWDDAPTTRAALAGA